MGLLRARFAFIAIIMVFVATASAKAADTPASGDSFSTLTDALMRKGSPGTLTALAAEMFGLPYRDYPEKYAVAGKTGGTVRVIEVVPGDTRGDIFFSEQTAAEIITARTTFDGTFITGLQR